MSRFAVIITSGQSVVGEIGAAGAIPVTANAGDTYVINVLASGRGGGGARSRTTLLVLVLALIWTLRRKRSASASAKPNSH
ncbi:MAG TPA: hypothetical protein VGG00_02985 [Rhodanobacter sp.]|jgi:hypothetical protein